MNNQINEINVFTNPNTHTMTIAYPKDEETIIRETYFMPEEIEQSDGYIVSYPYGDKSAPIVATFKNGYIYITFDRDCYEFEMPMVHLVGALAEIWYDTEDIDIIREYLVKYTGQNKIR